MPAFMFFWGFMALASFGFPGTNGFVGEILVFIGAFKQSLIIGALIVPGALLAAAYMFRVSLKMAWGKPSTASTWRDLSAREWLYLTVPAVFVLWIGLAPTPFFKVIDPSVNKLLNDFDQRKIAAVETEQPMQTAAADVLNLLAEKE
jgi:NADH-quinone oxidoreductase subunit M